ncbi:MAG TPA: DUF6599 family protein [Blastocatellia bacterium]|nr:DUF6599 family protein [Blastocatellia bacterium]
MQGHVVRIRLVVLAFIAGMACVAPAFGQAGAGAGPNDSGSNVVAVAPARPAAGLLPDSLGGIRATSEAKVYSPDDLASLVGNNAGIYREYHVVSGIARSYGVVRAEIYQTVNTAGAFGLFTCSSAGKETGTQPGGEAGGVPAAEGRVFWQGNYFVYLKSTQPQNPPAGNTLARIAGSISAILGPPAPPRLPSLLDSLPQAQGAAGEARYFLGPAGLAAYVGPVADTFEFRGDAEAVMKEYEQPAASPLKLLIVEFHTPQFAYDAMARVKAYVDSLPTDDQDHIVLRREGNYIVEATNVTDRDAAGRLVEEVKYPYVVKWLRNPLLPTHDPFQGQKTAQILLSTFGILGLLLTGGLFGGLAVGTAVFIKRRKQQREVFSDAGGMLRLDIEPLMGGAGPHRILSPGRDE